MKLHFYSMKIKKYLIFLLIFFYSFGQLYAKNIENTELFQLFEKEFNYISIDKKKFKKTQNDYFYKIAKEFLSKNIAEEIDKNLTVYSIAAEYLTLQQIPIDEIDFKYVEGFYQNFLKANFKKQCQTGITATGVFLSYGYGVTEYEFADDVLKCRKFINDTQFGLLILNLISSRSYLDKGNQSLEKLLLLLQNLVWKIVIYQNKPDNTLWRLCLINCFTEILFNLIYYYSYNKN